MQILIAEPSRMREIAITASVNETLPVIAKVGSAAVVLKGKSERAARLQLTKLRGMCCRAVPKRESVGAPRALRPPQKTVSHGETATGRRDRTRCIFGCTGAPSSGSASNSVVKRRIERSWRRARIGQPFAVSKGLREIHAGKMRFGWLARTALFFCLFLLSSIFYLDSSRLAFRRFS